MTKHILIVNGPNLNLLGTRQPEIYGSDTLDDIAKRCSALAKKNGFTLDHFQSNFEGGIVDAIQKAGKKSDGIIINPGAYSHTSIAIYDALLAFDKPVIEVHISNIHAREEFRHHSFVSACASGIIIGCGVQGYELAVERLTVLLK